MFQPVFIHGFVNRKTTIASCSKSLSWFGCLPRYTSPLSGYDVAESHANHTFIPYFAGLLGIYCRKGHFPLKGTNISSTVMSVPGTLNFGSWATNSSQMSLIGASLSMARLCSPGALLSKWNDLRTSLQQVLFVHVHWTTCHAEAPVWLGMFQPVKGDL